MSLKVEMNTTVWLDDRERAHVEVDDAAAAAKPKEKTMKKHLIRSALAAALVVSLLACGGGGSSDSLAVLSVDSAGITTLSAAGLDAALTAYPLSALSTAEAASLVYMREEEQLAHDVYAKSATLWAPPIFSNIASSEATPSAAVKTLLDRYQLADPLDGLANGTFKTPAFQALYDGLVAASRVSLIEALKVGVEIEKLD
ncbi:MAG: DUF2202 domain-containing protein, partial [Ramlibacter sp.]